MVMFSFLHHSVQQRSFCIVSRLKLLLPGAVQPAIKVVLSREQSRVALVVVSVIPSLQHATLEKFHIVLHDSGKFIIKEQSPHSKYAITL
jgi:hypothetical protein